MRIKVPSEKSRETVHLRMFYIGTFLEKVRIVIFIMYENINVL